MSYIVSHYYLPICNPPASRMGHFVRILTELYGGDRVRVVTGRPNYPNGELAEADRWKLYRRETGKYGETVEHLYEIPAPFKGFSRKTIGYLSFAASVFFYFLFKPMKKEDVVLITSGPVFPAYVLYFLSRVKRRLRYIVDVRDLSPQTVAGMGFMKETSLSYRFLKGLSDKTYASALQAVGVVPGICDYISSVTDFDDVHLIYNPVDTEAMTPMPESDIRNFRASHPELFQEGRTTFLFGGALSVYMDLITLMRAARLLREHTDAFLIIIIGYGEDADRLKAYVDENDLGDYVRFLPHMERTELRKYICSVDFCFSSISKDDIFKMVVSVKILEHLSCGKFVVGAHNGPFFEDLEKRGFAVFAPAGDEAALAKLLQRMIEQPPPKSERKDPRSFIRENFSLEQMRARLRALFEPIVPIAQRKD